MKQITIAIIYSIAFSTSIFSQNNIDGVLSAVERNNTGLAALKKRAATEKLGNKTGIYLQNPEVGFNYLWGSPVDLGNRTDISITQSLDFPTAYGHKRHISNFRNEQVNIEYQKQLRALLLETRLLCSDLVYTNALKSELSKRLVHAESIANSYKLKYDIGETNILEYNKAQLNLLNISKKLESIEIERVALLFDLARLNGGISISFGDSVFQLQELADDFELWYAIAEQNNPVLNWLEQEAEISRRQEKLNRAMSLPKLQAGYMSEKVLGTHFQGVTVGLSIPLWENKNTIQYAKANSLAIESISTDNKLQYYNRLKALHTKAKALQKNVNSYRSELHELDSSALLYKALDKGQISLIAYILEHAIYYASVNKLLELERELNITMAELNQYM